MIRLTSHARGFGDVAGNVILLSPMSIDHVEQRDGYCYIRTRCSDLYVVETVDEIETALMEVRRGSHSA